MKKYIFTVVLLFTGTLALIAGTVSINQKIFMEKPGPQPSMVEKNPETDDTMLNNVVPEKLAKPPFSYYLKEKTADKISPLKLKLISVDANKIIDTEKWVADNPWSEYIVPNPFQDTAGYLPLWVPTEYKDTILINAYDNEDTIFLIYGEGFTEGRYLAAINKNDKTVKYFLDFANFAYAPKELPGEHSYVMQALSWAKEEDGILYVAHSHLTYAKSSFGLNSYLTAIDTKDYHIIWRSQPLVCNTENFILQGDTIIAGYGFTQEPDYLYLLNKKNGKVYQKIKLKTGPAQFFPNKDKLLVRTYDTDYLFKINNK